MGEVAGAGTGKWPEEYEAVAEKYIRELDSVGTLLRHRKSGARVFLLKNRDDNKVFSITFRTPPSDSKGAAHIIEHTVLCGSERYPAKDPFIELEKGSLNTFLNAFTYPDKTVYPVASVNDQDFRNLMSVYMDAVFSPNITKTDLIFRQEGWHYELDPDRTRLECNGIVYNEMKGAFSSADEVLQQAVQAALFPDTPYVHVSGGDPEEIPKLTYQEYLAFYRRYYHPSNSYIYLYGDIDMVERLEWMDREYLGRYERIDPDSEIAFQKPFKRMREENILYPVAEGEAREAGYYYSWNKVCGDALDARLGLALDILDEVLLQTPGALLRKALHDAGLGDDVYGGYSDEIRQPFFNVTVKDAREGDKDRFVSVIEDTLAAAVRDGLDKKALLAAVNSMEFMQKEADYGRDPKGLYFGLDCLESWLYDDGAVFQNLEYEDDYEFMRSQIGTGFFEELIRTRLLENPFGVVVTACPKEGLAREKEERLAAGLRRRLQCLTSGEKEDLARKEKELRAYQETPTPPEILEKIPMLQLSDISREPRELHNEERLVEGRTLVWHEYFTAGIGYLDAFFDAGSLEEEEFPYAALMARVVGGMDTENFSYADLSNEVNLYTGGVSSGLSPVEKDRGKALITLRFGFSLRALYANLDKGVRLAAEQALRTDWSDDRRLLEILVEMRSRMKEGLQNTGHMTAIQRATSYFSELGYLNEQISGLDWYSFLDDLCRNFVERKDGLRRRMAAVRDKLFIRDGVVFSATCDREGLSRMEQAVRIFLSELPEGHFIREDWNIRPERKNEGLTCSSRVQFVARAGNFMSGGLKFTGSLHVLRRILNLDYLWKNLREQGGAYGCMCSFANNGNAFFSSFRDPHLGRTAEVFENIPAYVEQFSVGGREMKKYILGVISDLDAPMTPQARGRADFYYWYRGIGYEDIRRTRNEVLDTTEETIHGLAGHIRAILEDKCFCAVGNETRLAEERELFDVVRPLVPAGGAEDEYPEEEGEYPEEEYLPEDDGPEDELPE